MDLTSRSRQTATVAGASLVLITTLAIIACTGATPSPTPSPTVTPTAAPTLAPVVSLPTAASIPPDASPAVSGAQVCADLAAFQTALDDLTALDLGSVRIRDVIDAIGAVVTTGQAFVESSRAAFGPEGQALGDALAGLQAALQGLTGEGSLGDKAATIENAIDEVAAAFDALKAEVSPGCPAPEASGG